MNKRTLVEMGRRDMLRLVGTAMAAAIAPLPVLAQQSKFEQELYEQLLRIEGQVPER
jgi:hypothetical protein